jgi:hypothetical protein
MGFQSVVWMLNMMEELMIGLTLKEFCRSRRVGDSVIILQKRQNHYGQFLEITEYGKGGRHSYIIIPEGRESCGWGSCISQLRRLVKHFASARISGQQSKHIQGQVQVQSVEACRTFVDVARQSVEKESESLSKSSVGRIAIQPGSVLNGIGKER